MGYVSHHLAVHQEKAAVTAKDGWAQAAVSLGVVIAQGVNAGAQDIYPWGWRLSIALNTIPASAFLVSSWLLPDTPTSLLARGRPDLVSGPLPLPLTPSMLAPCSAIAHISLASPRHTHLPDRSRVT